MKIGYSASRRLYTIFISAYLFTYTYVLNTMKLPTTRLNNPMYLHDCARFLTLHPNSVVPLTGGSVVVGETPRSR